MSHESSAKGRELRVVVIDDDPQMLRAMTRALSDMRVTPFASANAMLASLGRDEPIDVIVCDLMMPEVTGADLFARLSERQPLLCDRFIIVTGGATTPETERFIEATTRPILAKPFDSKDFVALVRRVARDARDASSPTPSGGDSLERPTAAALEEALVQIDSAPLVNYRSVRYRSTEQARALGEFPAAHQRAFPALYADLRELLLLLGESTGPARTALLVAAARRLDSTISAARRLGREGVADGAIARAIHDVRGGALSAISLELAKTFAGGTEDGLATLRTIVRDQKKIMRNLVEGIDDEARRADLLYRPHALSQLVAGLTAFLQARGSSIRSSEKGTHGDVFVADSCVEFTALQRAVYNLATDAVSRVGHPQIDVAVAARSHHLRVALASVATAPRSHSYDELPIVAELVGHAYGVTSFDELTAGGYIGMRTLGDVFVAWLHWPLLETQPRR